MSQEFNIKPEHPTTWSDIMDKGVIRPHPKSTKEELWSWINNHAELLDNLRQQQLAALDPRVCRRS